MTEELRNMILDLEATERIANEISKRIDEYQIKNGLYYPISVLKDFKNKEIFDISLVEKKTDDTFIITKLYPCKKAEEMFMEWYCNEDHNYVGFLEMYYNGDEGYCGYYEDVIKKEMENNKQNQEEKWAQETKEMLMHYGFHSTEEALRKFYSSQKLV